MRKADGSGHPAAMKKGRLGVLFLWPDKSFWEERGEREGERRTFFQKGLLSPSLKCLFLLGVHQAGKSRIALLAFFFQPVQEALELGGRIGMTGPGGVVGAERRGGRQVGEGGDQLLFR